MSHQLINPNDRECSPCREDCTGCCAEAGHPLTKCACGESANMSRRDNTDDWEARQDAGRQRCNFVNHICTRCGSSVAETEATTGYCVVPVLFPSQPAGGQDEAFNKWLGDRKRESFTLGEQDAFISGWQARSLATWEAWSESRREKRNG